MNLESRIKAFSALGEVLRTVTSEDEQEGFNIEVTDSILQLKREINDAQQYNGWFTPEMVNKALKSLGESLQESKIRKWISFYDFVEKGNTATIGVVMAGNVPAVGFHDFLSVLISGNKILMKLSSDDNKLLPAIANVLVKIEPEFEDYILIADGIMKNFDAIIATGSNNTSRYFEYYFGKYPHIIRKNRNGLAVLTGNEEIDDLKALADDIFLYYGLGCRNVAKLYVPDNYDFIPLLKVLEQYGNLRENHKYHNNYDYNKAIFLVNGTKHFDAGNVLLTESQSFASPVSVINYEFYSSSDQVNNILMVNHNKIQCVISNADYLNDSIQIGNSQNPELWDYADGVDTLSFLLKQ